MCSEGYYLYCTDMCTYWLDISLILKQINVHIEVDNELIRPFISNLPCHIISPSRNTYTWKLVKIFSAIRVEYVVWKGNHDDYETAISFCTTVGYLKWHWFVRRLRLGDYAPRSRGGKGERGKGPPHHNGTWALAHVRSRLSGVHWKPFSLSSQLFNHNYYHCKTSLNRNN